MPASLARGFETSGFHELGELEQQVILHILSTPGTVLGSFEALDIVKEHEEAKQAKLPHLSDTQGGFMKSRLSLQGAATAATASPQGLCKGG